MLWNLLSLLVGVLVTMVVTRVSTTALKDTIGKLPDEFLERLKDDDRRKLTFEELEELVMERAYPTPYGLIPHECPRCGHDDFEMSGGETEYGDWASAQCKNCGWVAY